MSFDILYDILVDDTQNHENLRKPVKTQLNNDYLFTLHYTNQPRPYTYDTVTHLELFLTDNINIYIYIYIYIYILNI